ncbi:MAG: PQQ-binding-like beta-propeller repeat protein [Acidobacteria bacterium]|nr:PQQ-binding-like beta-propeller repeat protein [Acidobacteriota bacterium]
MRRLAAWSAALSMMALPALAQDWTTIGNDAQRSSWLRSDSKITPTTVGTPEFQLAWKMQLENEVRGPHALTPPVLLDFLISHQGFRSLAFLGGSEGAVFTIDTDLARKEWERRFGMEMQYPAVTAECPGGMTSSLSRPTTTALPALAGISGFGSRRREPGVSDVGQPGQGAVTLAARPAAPVVSPEAPKRNPRSQAAPRRSLRGLTLVYALTGDGDLRRMLASNGYDYEPPIPFLPPNANAQGLIVVDDETAYVATSNGCGGVADGVWALDIESGKKTSWKSGAGTVAGAVGPAMAPDGTLYVATSDGRVVALEPKTLSQQAVHKASGQSFVTAPVLIDLNDKDYIAVAAQDGSVHLLAGANLSGAEVAKTPGYAGAQKFAPGALATWRDFSGSTWLLQPIGGAPPSGAGLSSNGSVSQGAIVAWKIVEKDGGYAFEGGWVSPDLGSPLPPIVVNGVVFAADGGDLASGRPAKLYALDGVSGKALWDSGRTITAPAPTGGLSAGGGRVYLGAHDNTLYAFGFPIEH